MDHLQKQISEQIKEISQSSALIPHVERQAQGVSDAYFERQRAQNAENLKIAEHLKRKRVGANLEKWKKHVGERWASACLDRFIEYPEIHAKLIERLERFNTRVGIEQTSLLIGGKMGRGKTYLAYAYAYELIKAGQLLPHEVFFSTEVTLANIGYSGYRREELLRKVLSSSYKLYVIDDVGRAIYREDAERTQQWLDLIDHCYSKQKTLVITTNLPLKSDDPDAPTVRKWLGQAAANRLVNLVGNSGIVVMDGSDKREELTEKLNQMG